MSYNGLFVALLLCASTGWFQAQALAQGTYVAHVSSHRSHEDALAAFDKLKAKAPTALGDLKPFVHKVELPGKGTWHRLRVGPQMSLARAESLCQALLRAGHDYCKPLDEFELAKVKPGFIGEIHITPVGDGVNMRLTQPFGFVDSAARKWDVPAGSVTDGASIPRALWSIVGSPFTGKYLAAAVIHDHYVKTKRRTWEITHNGFYDAMLAAGVEKKQALLMWAAVYRFGPRWASNESYCGLTCAGGFIQLESVEVFPEFVPHEFDRIRSFVEGPGGVSQEQVLAFVDKTFFRVPDTEEMYPARIRGYVSGTIGDGDGDPRFKPRDWTEGKGNRRFVDDWATHRWPAYGASRDNSFAWHHMCRDCQTLYKVEGVARHDTLAVRTAPNQSAPKVGELPYNAEGIMVEPGCRSEWCRITFGNLTGYAFAKYLSAHTVKP